MGDRLTTTGNPCQFEYYAANALFSGILDTIRISVFPNEVTYFGSLIETGINGFIPFTSRQNNNIGNKSIAVVAGERISIALAWTRCIIIRRGKKLDFVIQTGRQVFENIFAVSVCGCGLQHFVGVIEIAIVV